VARNERAGRRHGRRSRGHPGGRVGEGRLFCEPAQAVHPVHGQVRPGVWRGPAVAVLNEENGHEVRSATAWPQQAM
jgi:hypothetical protein